MKGFGKIGIVFLVLVLALGALGVGYARWAENLSLEGTVNTGNINAIWSIEAVGDSEPEGKDVSSISAVIVGDTLEVTITGAYPCIDYWVDFNIESTGSVPIHLGSLVPGVSTLPAGTTVLITPDPLGTQLHLGNIFLGTLTVHLYNDAEELTNYTFSYSIEYAQYNEP